MKIQALNKISIALLFFCSGILNSYSQGSDNSYYSWPMEIEGKDGFVITLYQPQLETFIGNVLEGRMAVTILPEGKDMVFGAIWFKARMSTDMEARTVLLEEMDIVKTHFPEMVKQEKIDQFTKLLTVEIESWNVQMSLDRLTASLEEVDGLKEISAQINNEVPDIYFRNEPTILVTIDGDPKSKVDQESKVEYVVNTPFFIVKDAKKGDYYINGGPFWYTSKAWQEGWVETKKVPSKFTDFAKKHQQNVDSDSIAQTYDSAPALIITTKPAELILADGKIDYKPLDGTTLLYVSNSESDIIMDINSQKHYLLLSGRWFYSTTLKDGEWKFCEPKDLPVDFKKIPNDSEMSDVRVSIPGTPEAQTALLEQSIPQTAIIDRKTATVKVMYDGDPVFEKIEGLDISYATNADKTVLLINKKYYCVDQAVWFISNTANGPWAVSDTKPEVVDQIPPESPVYNVKYTYIYESNPEVVYVGYLPGYTYSYVYGGVVVYGTGYYYHSWYGVYYYPYPVTYGYGAHYNPYTGWGMTVGYSYGWVSWGYHPYHRRYWGSYGYRAGYRHGYRRGYHNGYKRGYAAGRYHSNYKSNYNTRNAYNNRSNGVKNSHNKSHNVSVNNKARTSNKSNNMYTDKKGNVYQRNDKGGFDNKSNRKPSTSQQPSKAQKASTQPSKPKSNNSSLERSHQSRSQGNQNYNRSRQSSGSYGGNRGGRSGGGRVRR